MSESHEDSDNESLNALFLSSSPEREAEGVDVDDTHKTEARHTITPSQEAQDRPGPLNARNVRNEPPTRLGRPPNLRRQQTDAIALTRPRSSTTNTHRPDAKPALATPVGKRSNGDSSSGHSSASPPQKLSLLLAYSDESSDNEDEPTNETALPTGDTDLEARAMGNPLAPSPTPGDTTESTPMAPPVRRNGRPVSQVKQPNGESVPEKKRQRPPTPDSSTAQVRKRAKPTGNPRAGPFLDDSSDDEPAKPVKSATRAKAAVSSTARRTLNVDQFKAMLAQKKELEGSPSLRNKESEPPTVASQADNSKAEGRRKASSMPSNGLQKNTTIPQARADSTSAGVSTHLSTGNGTPALHGTPTNGHAHPKARMPPRMQRADASAAEDLKSMAPSGFASSEPAQKDTKRSQGPITPSGVDSRPVDTTPSSKTAPGKPGTPIASSGKADGQIKVDTPREVPYPPYSAPVAKMLPENASPSLSQGGKAITAQGTPESMARPPKKVSDNVTLRSDVGRRSTDDNVSCLATQTPRSESRSKGKSVTERSRYSSEPTKDGLRNPKIGGKSLPSQPSAANVQRTLTRAPGQAVPNREDLLGRNKLGPTVTQNAGATLKHLYSKPKLSNPAQAASTVRPTAYRDVGPADDSPDGISPLNPNTRQPQPNALGTTGKPARHSSSVSQSNKTQATFATGDERSKGPVDIPVEASGVRKAPAPEPESASAAAKSAAVSKPRQATPDGNGRLSRKSHGLSEQRTINENAATVAEQPSKTLNNSGQNSAKAPISLAEFSRKATQPSHQETERTTTIAGESPVLANNESEDNGYFPKGGKETVIPSAPKPRPSWGGVGPGRSGNQPSWGGGRPVKDGNRQKLPPTQATATPDASAKAKKSVRFQGVEKGTTSPDSTAMGGIPGNTTTALPSQAVQSGTVSQASKPTSPEFRSTISKLVRQTRPPPASDTSSSNVSSTSPAQSAPIPPSTELPQSPTNAPVETSTAKEPMAPPQRIQKPADPRTSTTAQPNKDATAEVPGSPKNPVHHHQSDQNDVTFASSKPAEVTKALKDAAVNRSENIAKDDLLSQIDKAAPQEPLDPKIETPKATKDDNTAEKLANRQTPEKTTTTTSGAAAENSLSGISKQGSASEPEPAASSNSKRGPNNAVPNDSYKPAQSSTEEDTLIDELFDKPIPSLEPTTEQLHQETPTRPQSPKPLASPSPLPQAVLLPATQTDILGPPHFTYTVYQKHYTELDSPAKAPSTLLSPTAHDLSTANALATQLFDSTSAYTSAYGIKYEKRYQRRDENDCIQCFSAYVTGNVEKPGMKHFHLIWVERAVVVPHRDHGLAPETSLLNKTMYMLRLCRCVERVSSPDADSDSGSESEDSDGDGGVETKEELHYVPLDAPEIRSHGVFKQVFTTRGLANRAAMELQIALSLPKEPKKEMDRVWREKESAVLARELMRLEGLEGLAGGGKGEGEEVEEGADREMDGEGEGREKRNGEGCWDKRFNGLGGLKWKVWVEKVEVFGPRNM